MLPDYSDIAAYIILNYPKAKKIVEVGIGKEDSIYKELKKNPRLEVKAVDISPLENGSYGDVLQPDLKAYKDTDLVYSIRPPPELIPHIQKITERVGASLLIRPLSTDSCCKPEGMRLVNFGKAILWEEKR